MDGLEQVDPKPSEAKEFMSILLELDTKQGISRSSQDETWLRRMRQGGSQ
jgi:hypothetical protein